MIILSRGSLTETGRFEPETMALNLGEKNSTATVTMKIGTAELAVGDWLQDDTEPGGGIVWRVKTIDRQYNTDTETITLEHLIESLNDIILHGEIKPSTIVPGASTVTAKQAIDYILGQQGNWVLYDFDYSGVSKPYNFNNDSLKEAVETVSGSLDSPVWSYDFSVYPFRLNIKHLSSEICSEMRMSRNISTMKVTVDRSRMFTRFYPIGKNNVRLSAPGYVSKNEATWGVIEKSDTDNSKSTQAELTEWANERLDWHAEPLVTVTISGMDLSEATGETLDRLTIGTMCRVPLPEYGTTVTEKVTKLSWKDKLREPENVTVTLANQMEDIASIVNNLSKSSKKKAKDHSKQGEVDHAWMVDTNDHIGLIAEGVAGEGAATDWSIVASLMVDGNGIHQRVQEAQGQIVTAFSAIEQTTTQIYITVRDAKSDLYSYIDVTASGIAIAAAAASSSVYSVIEVTATEIRSEVSRRAKVFVQLTDPAATPAILSTLIEGDIWIKSTRVQNWNDMANKTWTDASAVDWNRYTGAEQFVWDGVNSRWEPVSDKGQIVEWGTRIDQTEKNISLIARALGAIDPSAIAEIDISSEAIQSAVSTAKSELYSVIRQTATNIVSYVANEQAGTMSYIDQTASSITQTVAKKNRVFIQMTDPATDNTVIDGDIWIQSVANDNVRPSWSDLSAKTWSSQSATNWRDYYSGAWYARKNGSWRLMREDADVVEIGTQLLQDEKQISLIARTVDENHIEMGARLTVTAQEIRGEVHAAKSTLYSVVSQTATNVFSGVYNMVEDNFSTIEQTASSIALQVNTAKSTMYTTIMQTATNIFSGVYNKVGQNFSTIEQTASSINTRVGKGEVISCINQTAESIVIQASKINLSGYVTNSMLESAFSDIQQATIEQLTIPPTAQGGYFTFMGQNVTWKTATIQTLDLANQSYFLVTNSASGREPTGVIQARGVRSASSTTIHYMGY